MLDSLVPFDRQPFKVDTESGDFRQLVDSIRSQGQIEPIVVRWVDERHYQIISGHRRVAACKELGEKWIRAVVRDMDDDEATVAMVCSNIHRINISISVKAKAYRMCLDMEKRKSGGLTAEQLGLEAGDSRATVMRLLRLSYLSDAWLAKIDDKTLTQGAGVELSYLDTDSQKVVYEVMKTEECNITPWIARAIRKDYEDRGVLMVNNTFDLFEREAAREASRHHKSMSVKIEDYGRYFDADVDKRKIAGTIEKLLAGWKEGRFVVDEETGDEE